LNHPKALPAQGEDPLAISYNFAAARKHGSIIELGLQAIRATCLGRPAILGMMQEISGKRGHRAVDPASDRTTHFA